MVTKSMRKQNYANCCDSASYSNPCQTEYSADGNTRQCLITEQEKFERTNGADHRVTEIGRSDTFEKYYSEFVRAINPKFRYASPCYIWIQGVSVDVLPDESLSDCAATFQVRAS